MVGKIVFVVLVSRIDSHISSGVIEARLREQLRVIGGEWEVQHIGILEE